MAKAKKQTETILPDEIIISKIYVIRGQKVMLDNDLAQLYEVQTKVLNQAVKRNIKRFPPDFMFQLTKEEFEFIRSQSVTLEKTGRGRYSKYNSNAFTEQGVAMLSGILTSDKAIDMNIAIMRAFVETRKAIFFQNNISKQIGELKDKLGEHDIQLNGIYEAIENMMDDKVEKQSWINRKQIGFNREI